MYAYRDALLPNAEGAEDTCRKFAERKKKHATREKAAKKCSGKCYDSTHTYMHAQQCKGIFY